MERRKREGEKMETIITERVRETTRICKTPEFIPKRERKKKKKEERRITQYAVFQKY